MKTLKPFARTITFLYACMMLGCASAPLAPSKAISNFVAFNLVNSTYTVVADLASKNLDSSDHQITKANPGVRAG